MKPISLGYQPGSGLGNAKFETQQGISLNPETKAVKANTLPTAINSFAQQLPYIKNNLDAYKSARSTNTTQIGHAKATAATPAAESVQAIPDTISNTTPEINIAQPNIADGTNYLQQSMQNTAVNGFTPAEQLSNSIAGNINDFTSTASSGIQSVATTGLTEAQNIAIEEAGQNMVNSLGGIQEQLTNELASQAAEQGAEEGGSALGKAAGIGGKALGAIGALYGLYNMGGQMADFGSHRDARDMAAMMGKNYYTTDKGNQYMTYSGPNLQQELAYNSAQKTAKQTNFALSSIGTGASIGSLFGPVGTGIGAAAGAILGGIGHLFGWGDNKDEIFKEAQRLSETVGGYNRMQASVAKSKDASAEFNDRVGVAAEGKGAYENMKTSSIANKLNVLQGPNGVTIGKPASLLEPGEYTYDPINMTGAKVTGKGSGDKMPSYIEPNDQNIVFSKKLGFAKYAAPLIEEMNKLDKIASNAGGSEEQQKLQAQEVHKRKEQLNDQLLQLSSLQNMKREQNNMRKYKNGKLPGFADGTWVDYGLSALPHIGALVSSAGAYNRAKYADTYAPSTYVSNPAGVKALDELAQLRFDPRQYLNDAQRAYNQANWQANRMAGLGAGGQAILRNANLQSYLNSIGNIRKAEQEANNQYRTAHANALAQYGAREQAARIADNTQRFNWQQQQNAAKEYYLDQYRKNMITPVYDLEKDVMGVRQFDRSQDYDDKMLGLYAQQVENDKKNAEAALANALAARQAGMQVQNANSPTFYYTQPGLQNLYGMLDVPQLTAPKPNLHYSWMKGYKDGKDSNQNDYWYTPSIGPAQEEIETLTPIRFFSGGGMSRIITPTDTSYQQNSIFGEQASRKVGSPSSRRYETLKNEYNKKRKNAEESKNPGISSLARLFKLR